jgi:aconitate hydratase
MQVVARADDGATVTFDVTCRIDGPIELDYYRNGGILPAVLRRLAREGATDAGATDAGAS